MTQDNPDWDKENWGQELAPDSNLALKLPNIQYSFENAIADIVDNSITHGDATNVWIDVATFQGEKLSPYIAIIDDGNGMNEEELNEALVYATYKEYDDKSLGKFGLGMKVAGTSQSRVLTVCSRDDANADFACLSWDLNMLESRIAGGKWMSLKPKLDSIPQHLFDYLGEGTGTIVFLSDLSQIITDIDGLGEAKVGNLLDNKLRKTINHLGMVFHRFIEGTTSHYGDKKLNIFVNDVPIHPWDPFARWHQASRHHPLDEQGLSLENEITDDYGGRISLEFYGKTMSFQARILPKDAEFYAQEVNGESLSKGAVSNYVGMGKWNDMQGVYFYRMDRIIQAGKWSSVVLIDEHCKLARVSIDVDRSWDDVLQLSINKTFVRLPNELVGTPQEKGDIRKIFGNIRGRAKAVYDGPPEIEPPGGFEGEGDQADPAPEPAPAPPPPPPAPPPPPPPTPGIKEQIKIELKGELLEVCEEDSEKDLVVDLFGRMGVGDD